MKIKTPYKVDDLPYRGEFQYVLNNKRGGRGETLTVTPKLQISAAVFHGISR